MKMNKYLGMALASVLFFSACSDDEKNPGNPTLKSNINLEGAMFGDSLQFTADVSDQDVPLSTLKAQLFYGEEMVSETVIRTKTNSEYSGKIFVPYYANVPNGTATLKMILQNIHFTIKEDVYNLPLTRPDFSYLTFVTADKEYRMERIGLYQYAVKAVFPQKIKGYIKAPKMGNSGNEILFGWDNGAIKEGNDNPISFSSVEEGEYTISFNTSSYAAAPFIKLAVNGTEMSMVDDSNYKVDMNLTQGEALEVTGIAGMDSWTVNSDFYAKGADGKLTFLPINGSYRITANFELKYISAEVLKDGNPASLQADGTGGLWILGDGAGKPTLANAPGWNDVAAFCMSPIAKGKYQVTLVGGVSIAVDDINFKFFHQKGWGGEYTHETISTTSNLILIGNKENGKDPGNLGLIEGKTLQENATYVFTVDVTAGIDKAVLTVVQK